MKIEGVVVSPLKMLPNEHGRLMEVQRNDDDIYPGFGQAYVTETFPGVVKAWYRHQRQIDQIAVVTGLLKLVMYDDREGSPTNGTLQTVVLGELSSKLVQIPPMVWHGFQALGTQSAFLLHLNSMPYDFSSPDEERINKDSPLIPHAWT